LNGTDRSTSLSLSPSLCSPVEKITIGLGSRRAARPARLLIFSTGTNPRNGSMLSSLEFRQGGRASPKRNGGAGDHLALTGSARSATAPTTKRREATAEPQSHSPLSLSAQRPTLITSLRRGPRKTAGPRVDRDQRRFRAASTPVGGKRDPAGSCQ